MSILTTKEIVQAGAGAGKTTNLTLRVYEYANQFREKNKKWPKMVVSTFTRKATQELKERLSQRAIEQNNTEFLDYLLNSGNIHISTLHGVFSLFLKEYGSLFGYERNFKITSNKEIFNLVKEDLVECFFNKEERSGLLEHLKLSEVLEAAIEFDEKSLFGKFQNLKKETLSCLLNKYVREIKQMVSALQNDFLDSEELSEKWMEWISILKDFPESHKFDEMEEWSLAAEQWKSRLPRKPSKKGLSDEFIHAVNLIQDKIKKLISLRVFSNYFVDETIKMNKILLDYFNDTREIVSSLKKSRSLLSISDIEILTFKILKEEPELGREFSLKWDYWLLDEYQDTSPLQVEILKKLVGNSPYYIVGDPQQSIYLFRGSRSEVFYEKVKEVESLREGKISSLLKNYRSQPSLLYFFNEFFASLSGDFKEMEAKSTEFNLNEDVASFIECENEERELIDLISNIQKKEGSYSQIAVLSRTHKDLEFIATELKKVGIPVTVTSTKVFTETREVRDILTLFKFFLNPFDDYNLVEVLRSPWLKLSDEDLSYAINLRNEETSHWDVLIAHKESLSDQCIEVIDLLEQKLSEGGSLYYRVLSFIDEFQIFDFVEKLDLTGLSSANIWKLLHSLQKNEREDEFDYYEFIQKALNNELSDPTEGREAIAHKQFDSVQLMTIHASKGLKFDHVILPGFAKAPNLRKETSIISFHEEKMQWSLNLKLDGKRVKSLLAEDQSNVMNQKESEEYDRLLYVALTRAVKKVYLVWEAEEKKKGSWLDRVSWRLEEESCQGDFYKYSFFKKEEVGEELLADRVDKKNKEQLLDQPMYEYLGKDKEKKSPLKKSVSALSKKSALFSMESSQESVQEKKDVRASIHKIVLGNLIHRVIEQVSYHGLNDELMGLLKNKWTGYEKEIESTFSYIKEEKEFPLYEVIQQGYSEWGFQFKENQTIVEGQIDLWGIVAETCWLVDFKTGSSKGYRNVESQLMLYKKALEKVVKDKPIICVAAYPLEKKSFRF